MTLEAGTNKQVHALKSRESEGEPLEGKGMGHQQTPFFCRFPTGAAHPIGAGQPQNMPRTKPHTFAKYYRIVIYSHQS